MRSLILMVIAGLSLPAAVRAEVMMFGDSQVARGSWKELLGRDDVVNLGLDGDTIRGATRRVRKIEPQATHVFVMLGINDLVRGRPPDSCVDDMSRLLERLRAVAPGARLVVTSVLPVGPRLRKLMPKIKELDRKLEELCDAGTCEYLDLSRGFEPSHLGPDGLHLSKAGYAMWALAIQRYDAEVASRPPS